MAAVVLASEGHSQDDPKNKKPEYSVSLFEHKDFKGKSVTARARIRESVPDLTQENFNDKASSLKWNLPENMVAVLCDFPNYRRPVLVLVDKGEIKNLPKDYPNIHDTISSIKFHLRPRNGDRPPGVPADVPVVPKKIAPK